MSLPPLYALPTDPASWQSWSFNHAAIHYTLVFAAQQQKNQSLLQFQLDPVDPNDLGLWLYNHQTMHNQLNLLLGTTGYNLLELDWQDPDQLQQWMQWNGNEHLIFSQKLGV